MLGLACAFNCGLRGHRDKKSANSKKLHAVLQAVCNHPVLRGAVFQEGRVCTVNPAVYMRLFVP